MLSRLSILLADDHPMILEGLRQLLSQERDGRLVLTANDGMRALEIYRQQGENIGLIVTDISMPGIDGFELLRRIEKLATKEVGAIILSVHEERSWISEFYKLSGSLVYKLDFITKSKTADRLLGAIKEGIEFIEQRR